ncbi:poly-gamma-glutamate synthesis protein (capsule biosynthesis protein) [Lachnospiraceae bacterium]|nr:poly-gamma-glutamate synthesis protein (capsule biosynthesis protein) [Lachnospiraceae bacterium]
MDDLSREEIIKEMNRRKREKREARERQIRKMKQMIAIVAVLFVVLVVAIVVIAKKASNKSEKVKSKSDKVSETDVAQSDGSSADGAKVEIIDDASKSDAAPEDFEIKMNFVGDCCMASDLQDTSEGTLLWYEQNYPTSYFFDGVRSVFEADDFTVANCENVFSDSDVGPRDKGDDIAYWFKAPTRFAKVFSDNSIEAVTINNNHTEDYGDEDFEDTKKALDAAGVDWGFRDKIIYYEKGGYKIAVVCVSYYDYEEAEGILPWLKTAVENSDFQIVFFHGGIEHVFYVEDWKVEACHLMIDNGADLVLGSHPHVLQRREKYNGADIVYSLGNFCFGGNTAPQPNRTIIYGYTLKLHKEGDKIELVDREENMIPCYIYTGDYNNWQPAIVEDEDIKKEIIDYMNGELEELY